jgi:putative aminophosphonate oxidoreductase
VSASNPLATLRADVRLWTGQRGGGAAPVTRHRSLWLREVLGEASDTQPLEGAQRADVAIVGGGYVGLWTAIRIKEHDPACDVAVLEADICGGGASGRNGGMVLPWWPKLASLTKVCGTEESLRLGRASEVAIDEIEAFCRAHGVDAHFRRGGFLWTATADAHIDAWEPVVGLCERLGVDAFRRLAPTEVAERSGSEAHLAGVLDERAATVQPAALVRGLRRVALEAGVRIYEHSEVLHFSRERPPAIRTRAGLLTAEKLVLATNAWAAGLPELRRSLVVVSSDIVATPPIPDRLAAIGWTGGEGITDSQMMVGYYRTTHDGRIAFGKGTAGVALGGRIGERFDRDAKRATMAVADFRRYYPALADVPIELDWAGPIDRTATSIPILGHLTDSEHILYGVGWSGNGIGPSVVGGRILAALALGIDDEWSRAPLIDRPHDAFPPEPVRFLGAQLVRHAVARKERTEADGATPNAIAARLAKLAPAGLEDKE